MNFSTRRMRGSNEVLGMILMLLVTVGLVGQALMYALPYLRKGMEKETATYFEQAMIELADAIKITALQGGETIITIDSKGPFSTSQTIKLTPDLTGSYIIELRTATQIARYAPTDVPLNDFIGPYNQSSTTANALTKAEGIVDINEPVVVTGSSIQLPSRGIRMILKVVPRPIRDPSKNLITEIELQPLQGNKTEASLPVKVIIKKLGESANTEIVNVNSTTGSVTRRIIRVGVRFE